MMSARDTVAAIESNGLDAITIFTVTMGLAATILAWEFVVFALKGWAVRKECAVVGKPLLASCVPPYTRELLGSFLGAMRRLWAVDKL